MINKLFSNFYSLDFFKNLDCNYSEIESILVEKEKAYQYKNYQPMVESFLNLPFVQTQYFNFSTDEIKIGIKKELSSEEFLNIEKHLFKLIPWRKGPFNFFGHKIDTEWQSQLKWKLLKPFINQIQNKKVLDIGANSGYYMFKILEHKPKFVLGIDPTIPFKLQFETFKKYLPSLPCFYELLGIEDLIHFHKSFDIIFCMGILYHQKSPIDTLKNLKKVISNQGKVFLETLVIKGENEFVLSPYKTYGKMKNCYFIPTVKALKGWCLRAGFQKIKLISNLKTTLNDQRNTPFYPRPMQTLKDFLDPKNRSKTIEGYPAHQRVLFELEA